MNHLKELERFRIALNLVIFNSQRIKSAIRRLKLDTSDLLVCPSSRLMEIGFNQNQTEMVKNHQQIANHEIKLANQHNIQFIFKESPHYPQLLKEIFSPPDYLYAKGNLDVLTKSSLSVVGSRKASQYGLNAVEQLLTPVVKSGIVIVSGMAYGIDAKAHEVAIKNRGLTIGVNPGGLLNLYPRGNQPFLKKILEQGCIISEFPLNTVPRPFFFPVRNRIIAGCSKALLVGEADLNSGSLITAGFALEQNRDILAIPGCINVKNSRGTNKLIQSGAKMAAKPHDILEEFNISYSPDPPVKQNKLTKIEQKLLDLTDPNSVKGIDYFVEKTCLPVPLIVSTLVGMRLKGLIKEEQGGYIRVDER